MDTATSGTRAVAFTPGGDGDSPVLPDLPDQIPEGEDTGSMRRLAQRRRLNPCPA